MRIDLPAVTPDTGRRKTLPPVVITSTAETDLYAIVMEGVRLWSKLIRERLIPAYSKPQPVVMDAVQDGRLQWLIDQIDTEVNNRVFYQTEKLGRWVTKQGSWHTGKTISSVKSATGVDVSPFLLMSDIRPTLETSITVNVDLIKGLNADTKRRVEMVMFDAIAMRRNQKYVTRELALAMGISQRKARLIARDQTHKLNSLLTRLRNEQLGIEAYVWLTMRDDKVRRVHRERQDKVFRWDTPPYDGHPGYPINCRCVSAAVLHYGDTD